MTAGAMLVFPLCFTHGCSVAGQFEILAPLTNAFSKKVENHVHALAIYFMHHNFVRIHQTTCVTPAMAAGVTDKLWELADIVRIVDEWETKRK